MGYLWSFLSDRSVRLIRSDKSDDFIFWTPKLNIPVLEKKKKKKDHFLAVWDVIGTFLVSYLNSCT